MYKIRPTRPPGKVLPVPRPKSRFLQQTCDRLRAIDGELELIDEQFSKPYQRLAELENVEKKSRKSTDHAAKMLVGVPGSADIARANDGIATGVNSRVFEDRQLLNIF
jgi:hypothetical protein